MLALLKMQPPSPAGFKERARGAAEFIAQHFSGLGEYA